MTLWFILLHYRQSTVKLLPRTLIYDTFIILNYESVGLRDTHLIRTCYLASMSCVYWYLLSSTFLPWGNPLNYACSPVCIYSSSVLADDYWSTCVRSASSTYLPLLASVHYLRIFVGLPLLIYAYSLACIYLSTHVCWPTFTYLRMFVSLHLLIYACWLVCIYLSVRAHWLLCIYSSTHALRQILVCASSLASTHLRMLAGMYSSTHTRWHVVIYACFHASTHLRMRAGIYLPSHTRWPAITHLRLLADM